MKMNVRACVLATVLILLGASSMFAQNVWSVGAPVGSVYAATNDYNLAMNSEGLAELGAPVSICATTGGGGAVAGSGATAGAGASITTFNVGDVYTIEYTIAGGNDPVFTSTTLGAGNIYLVSSAGAAGAGVIATATAAMTLTAGAAPPGGVATGPQAIVTISITGAPAATTGINCITIQGLRFNLSGTNTATVNGTTFNAGVPNKSVINAVVKQTVYNGTTIAPTNPVLGLPPVAAGPVGVGTLNPTFPVVGGVQSAVNTVASAFSTLAANTGGAVGLSNSTGVNQLQKIGLAAFSGTATGTIVNGPAKTGTFSINQNPIPTGNAAAAGACAPACAGGTPVNLPIPDGGALFRGYTTAAGPDQTTWLNAAGATIGTGITLTLANMPSGSSVVFPASVSSTSPGVVWTMTGGGTVSAPGGSVTYNTTINEGTPYTIGAVGTSVGASMDITFTVTPGPVTSSAIFPPSITYSLAPPAGSASVPSYAQISLAAGNETVFPLVTTPPTSITLFTVGTNQTTRAYPFVLFSGATTPTSFDTGVVVTNTGRGVSEINGAPCYTVAPGGSVPAGCGPPFGGTTSTNGTNGGQDGPFTVFFMSNGATITSLRSTASNFPSSSTGCALTSSGSLPQGSSCAVLLSQLLSAAGITGTWQGELRIITDFPNSSGFAFISQFTNLSGGATMGFVAQ